MMEVMRLYGRNRAAWPVAFALLLACCAVPCLGQAKAVPAPLTIAAFGDSLTAGYGVDRGQSYPADLQRDLRQRGMNARVLNFGVSGDTTTDGLARLAEVIDARPRIVILEFGGNDGLRGVPVSATRRNLQQMIEKLRAVHIAILLVGMSLPPNYGGTYIDEFQRIYTELAHQYDLPLVPFIYQDLVARLRQNPNQQPPLLQADGIHATAAGNQIVAQTILHYLWPMLTHSGAAR